MPVLILLDYGILLCVKMASFVQNNKRLLAMKISYYYNCTQLVTVQLQKYPPAAAARGISYNIDAQKIAKKGQERVDFGEYSG